MRTSMRRVLVPAVLLLVIGLTIAAASLPARLGDGEFWRLVSDSSEADGSFRSDNLLSNELGFQFVVPELARTTKVGRVYMGVGPEQNFTYIAATKPAMAFIVDIRRGNLDLQLMYKALFEMSADRAEFVGRLFARKRPAGLRSSASAAQLFSAFAQIEPTETYYEQTLKEIERQLTAKHGF